VVQYNDKIIIDQFTYDSANKLAMDAKSSPYLQHIFNPNSNFIVLFQVPVYITTTGFVGKCLIDCIVIDLEKKTITPYDFKTFEGSFEQNYWSFKYYYQEAWYATILRLLTKPESFIDCTIPEQLQLIHSGEYTIEQFKFIAIDKGEFKVRIKSIGSLILEAKHRLEIDNWRDDYQMITNGVKKLWL